MSVASAFSICTIRSSALGAATSSCDTTFHIRRMFTAESVTMSVFVGA